MEEKKARRNKRIMIVTAMLVLLLAIVGIGGFTFAKYVTSKQVPTTTATVAKWGYTITLSADDFFGSKYEKDGTDTLKVSAKTSELSAAVNTGNSNIVCPGASGSMTFTITGTSEVAAKITITATEGNEDIWVKPKNGTKYEPIKWSLIKDKGGAGESKLVENKTFSELTTALTGITDTIAPNDQKYKTGVVYTLSWSWAFSQGHDDDDTALAAIANNPAVKTEENGKYNGYDANTELSLGFTISIEQTIIPTTPVVEEP